MSIKRLLLALAFAIGLACPAAAAPLEAYGKLPSIEAVSISPGGQMVALLVTNGEQRVLAIKDLPSNAFVLRADMGTERIVHVQWVDDRHVLFVNAVTASPIDVIATRRDWLMAFSLDLTSRKTTALMRGVDKSMNTILGAPTVRRVNGEAAVFVDGIRFGEDGRARLSAFRLDPARGSTRLMQIGTLDTRNWVVGPDGELVGEELYDTKTGRWTLRVKRNGDWQEVQTLTAIHDRPYVLGLGRDGKSVLYASADGGGRWGWREARLDDAKPAEPLPIDDNQTAIRDPQDNRLIGHFTLVGDERRYTFFDPEDARVWRGVSNAFPGAIVQLRSWSADKQKIVVRVDAPDDSPALALVDLATRKATWLGVEHEGLRPQDIAPKQAIRFKAADGLELTGYLTLPRGKAPKNLPLIVDVHDGPATRDRPGFNWWDQALASRGYAVLKVNFRGSDGLGDALLAAGYGEWGRKMQTDLSDGVRSLVAQGIVDPKRVCITGGGYGGYAALAGATLDRGVYRCAVSVAGISDLKRQLAYARASSGLSGLRYWMRFMGAKDDDDPVLARYSPLTAAGDADIPILLIHGKDDTAVRLEQSQLMADALKKAGKPGELRILKGGDHWLLGGEARLETLNATVAFVEKHNPPN